MAFIGGQADGALRRGNSVVFVFNEVGKGPAFGILKAAAVHRCGRSFCDSLH